MKPRYYDPFEDDRRECAHGNVKNCQECEAEGERIAYQERLREFGTYAAWFAGGFLACIIVDAARAILL